MSQLHLSRAEVRAFDKRAIDVLGIPVCVLMENAGRGAAQILHDLGISGKVIICCGKGNNGGDGLVLARHLANWNHNVTSLLFSSPNNLTPDAALQWNIIQKMGLPAQIWGDHQLEEAKLATTLHEADWIVDALFGTGVTGPVRQPFDRVINAINN